MSKLLSMLESEEPTPATKLEKASFAASMGSVIMTKVKRQAAR
jgi:hypothetical protein